MRLIIAFTLLAFFTVPAARAQNIEHANALGDFYQMREGAPFWLKKGKLNKKGKALLNVLQLSWQNGLNPKNYHLEIIEEILSHKKYGEKLGSERAMDLELLLSDAYVSYARDLSASRVLSHARTLSLREKDWPKAAPPNELLERASAFEGKDFNAFLRALEPQGSVYQALKEKLSGKEDLSEQRYHQIIVNMERLRWMPREVPERYILVNIAAGHLWAIENGALAFDMPVAVGRVKRQTEVFISHIDGVRINPSWTLPETIKREDLLPKLIQDAGYLLHRGIEVYDGYGRDSLTIDPTSIPWAALSRKELNGLRFVQRPGVNNPLGRYRILMPNQYDIYLHDTNERQIFSAPYEQRFISSGCVRVEDPARLSAFILKTAGAQIDTKIESILKEGKERELYTQENMPVYMLYYTIWPGDNGEIIFGQDVYGRDKKLLQVLEKLDGFVKISNN